MHDLGKGAVAAPPCLSPAPVRFSHFFLLNDFSPLSRSLEQAKLDFVFLTKILEYFGCCPSLLNWVSYKCFYSKKKSRLLKNGWTSSFSIFNSKSDKASLYPIIFILSVEILAKAIRRNQNISGILVIQEEIAHIRFIKILTRL